MSDAKGGWLAGWLAGWLVGWLVGWLAFQWRWHLTWKLFNVMHWMTKSLRGTTVIDMIGIESVHSFEGPFLDWVFSLTFLDRWMPCQRTPFCDLFRTIACKATIPFWYASSGYLSLCGWLSLQTALSDRIKPIGFAWNGDTKAASLIGKWWTCISSLNTEFWWILNLRKHGWRWGMGRVWDRRWSNEV